MPERTDGPIAEPPPFAHATIGDCDVVINLLRGLAFGLGSVLRATTLVYATVQILAQIEFIPILGDWAIQLIEQIEMKR